MGNGDSEEAVGALEETSHGVPPSDEGSDETEDTSDLDGGSVNVTGGILLEVTDSEEEEGDVEEDEERAEGNGGLEGAEAEKEGKDEPTRGK